MVNFVCFQTGSVSPKLASELTMQLSYAASASQCWDCRCGHTSVTVTHKQIWEGLTDSFHLSIQERKLR